MNRVGWLINDQLTAIPGTKTFWHDLLAWFPDLIWPFREKYVDYAHLGDVAEQYYWTKNPKPQYIVRNGSYFRSLDVDVPTISFVQDIMGSEKAQTQQDSIVRNSRVVVFNSTFTAAHATTAADVDPRLHVSRMIIPIGVNTDVFTPKPAKACREKYGIVPFGKSGDTSHIVLWVGAKSTVKGYDVLQSIIEATPYTYVLVSKDELVAEDYKDNPRVKVLTRIGMGEMVEVYATCSVLLCTSRLETQHLASIEAAACGRPIVTTPVGVWHDWGPMAKLRCLAGEVVGRATSVSEMAAALAKVLRDSGDYSPRSFILKSRFTREKCRESWTALLNLLEEEY
jgi:glycosyltransferase involved in cell wall biosynthesis